MTDRPTARDLARLSDALAECARRLAHLERAGRGESAEAERERAWARRRIEEVRHGHDGP